MADISVIDGPVPVVVLILGAIALLILLARRGRTALVTLAVAVVVAVVTFLGLNWLLTRGLSLFPETLPTVGALAGSTGDVSPLTGSVQRPSANAATPVVDRWTGPATGTSQVLTTPIPGTVSGFTGRDAYIYLPAAYFDPSPPLLPVLVLVSGQPGGPQDWIVSGNLQTQMDQFAAANGGLAPVVVVVDPNGPNDTVTM